MADMSVGAGAPDAVADPSAGVITVDPPDVEALWRQHYPALVRLARLLVDDRESAEEVVQDAFVRVYGRIHRVTGAKAPVYLRSAVLNRARSNLRRRKVARDHLDETVPYDTRATGTGELHGYARHEVVHALRGLPRRQREVLALRYYLDLPERETADALGISVGSVKTHAHRGLAALAELLEPTS